MSILESIISYKKEEVQKRKLTLPLERIKHENFPNPRDFKSAFEKKTISIIAEIKRMSPSAGMIREDFNHVQIAKIYEENGASAVSVLTDNKFFGGTNDYLIEIKKEINLPVLRKEFVIDEYQIYESRWLGADAVLLIARILTHDEIDRFISLAKELGMACLVEVHTPSELKDVLSTSSEIVGINNRNLDTLAVGIKTSLELKRLVPKGYITVSESGIKNRGDVLRLQKSGFDGVLVGETLMRTKKIGDKLKELSGRNSEGP